MNSQQVRATDVYGITRELPMNYVTRQAVDDELVSALARDQHLVIYGSSKQGKTSVRKYNLKEDEYLVVVCGNRWTLAQVHAAILKAAGYSIVQTETRAASGAFKISATAKIAAKLFGSGGEAGATADTSHSSSSQTVTARLELDPADVNDIISALREIGFDRWIVLEDFHYLPEETQKDFAVALKAYHEGSSLTFIIVGVWLQENRLVQFNGDLSGRVSTINADLWNSVELEQAIHLGERQLNIEFEQSFVEVLTKNCFDSIYVVQEACLLACQANGVNHKQAIRRLVRVDDPAALILQVVDRQSARFSDFLVNFASGFGETDLEMYRWLLVPVIVANPRRLETGIPYRHIRRQLGIVHPRGQNLNAGNVTQALKSAASLQVQQGVKPLVLDYDQSLKKLNVVDRSFLIWLGQQDRAELLESIDVQVSVLSDLEEKEEEEEEEEE